MRTTHHAKLPKLYLVIDTESGYSLVRGLSKPEARGYLRGWRAMGGHGCIVPERVKFAAWPWAGKAVKHGR